MNRLKVKEDKFVFRIVIPRKIARRQNIKKGDILICEEHVCGGLIYKKDN